LTASAANAESASALPGGVDEPGGRGTVTVTSGAVTVPDAAEGAAVTVTEGPVTVTAGPDGADTEGLAAHPLNTTATRTPPSRTLTTRTVRERVPASATAPVVGLRSPRAALTFSEAAPDVDPPTASVVTPKASGPMEPTLSGSSRTGSKPQPSRGPGGKSWRASSELLCLAAAGTWHSQRAAGRPTNQRQRAHGGTCCGETGEACKPLCADRPISYTTTRRKSGPRRHALKLH
jgi:hypothetical protein